MPVSNIFIVLGCLFLPFQITHASIDKTTVVLNALLGQSSILICILGSIMRAFTVRPFVHQYVSVPLIVHVGMWSIFKIHKVENIGNNMLIRLLERTCLLERIHCLNLSNLF